MALHNKIHTQFSYRCLIPAFLVRCMFLNVVLYMASLFVNMYRTALVYFHLQLELELSPFDTISDVAGYVGGQILEIELLNFFDYQYQM